MLERTKITANHQSRMYQKNKIHIASKSPHTILYIPEYHQWHLF